MNKKYCAVVLLLCLMILMSACKRSGAATGGAPRTPFIGGTSAITLNFEKDSPPPEVTDDQSFAFNVLVRMKNDGEYAVDRNNIRLNLVGFDPNDFGAVFDDLRDVQPDDNLDSKKRDGEGNIVEGTTTFATFPKSGASFVPSRFSGNTEFTFRADACYYYETETGPSICIDPQPFSTENKVCQVQDLTFSSGQGAPIAITRIDQEAFATKTQFRITIKNAGNGEVAEPDSSRCSTQTLGRDQIDKVRLDFARVSTTPLDCGPFIDNSVKGASGTVRLISGEGSIICELPSGLYSSSLTAYTTPLSIKLSYTYRTHTQRNLMIVKE